MSSAHAARGCPKTRVFATNAVSRSVKNRRSKPLRVKRNLPSKWKLHRSPRLPRRLRCLTIGFRNPVAVRAAVIASAFATIAGLIPFPGLFHSLWQLVTIAAGGFASVYLYQRRTGDYLSLRGGLQIGWMTGLFCFIVTMVMLTLLLAVFAGVGESGLQKITAESGRPEIAEVFSGMLTNPAMLVFALVSAFFVMTVLASAGGALGSKVLDKE